MRADDLASSVCRGPCCVGGAVEAARRVVAARAVVQHRARRHRHPPRPYVKIRHEI